MAVARRLRRKAAVDPGQIRLNGHAIEARVYAENPHKNFMPSVGRIKTWRMPEQSAGLRIDAGYREGDAVSPHYDAMLAKMIAWAPIATPRSSGSIAGSKIRCSRHRHQYSIPVALVTHPAVRANTIDTGFIERELKNLTPATAAPGDLELCTAVSAILATSKKPREPKPIRRG